MNILSILVTGFVSFFLGYFLIPEWIISVMGEAGKFPTTENFLRWLFFLTYFYSSQIIVPKQNLLTIVVFGKRTNIFFGEGWTGTLFPYPVISGVLTDIREITLGEEKGKDDKSSDKIISIQTRDDAEVMVAYSAQVEIKNPNKWFNIKDPAKAINNKLISQLRAIISLFNSGDVNDLRGIIAGILEGKSYVVWRNIEDNSLLRKGGINGESNISGGVEVYEILPGFDTPEYTHLQNFQEEVIPPDAFGGETAQKETVRLGAVIKTVAIKDITPPEEILKAATELEKENLQGAARIKESKMHVKAALIKMGLDPENDSRQGWTDKDWERFNNYLAETRIQDKIADEVVVRHVGSRNGGGSELGDSLIASQILANRNSGTKNKKGDKKNERRK